MVSQVRFREVEVDDAGKILAWRTDPRVADQMKTSVANDLDLQIKWVERSYRDPSYYHWIFSIHGSDAGLLSLTDFDLEKAETHWGFYIGDERFIGFGALVPPYFYNWAFGALGVERIHAVVASGNKPAIRMNEFHGYVKDDSLHESESDSDTIPRFVSYTLHKASWGVREVFSNKVTHFPCKKWLARPKHLTL